MNKNMSETPKHTHTTETENTPLLTWGEGHATVENYSRDYSCLNPECKNYGKDVMDRYNDINLNDIVIGLQKAPPELQRENRTLALIWECNGCFQTFWFHLDDRQADGFEAMYELGEFKKAQPKK